MTYQIGLYKDCKFCGDIMNHCGDRGNGKQRDYCDRECSRKMYVLRKRIENYMQQIELKKNRVGSVEFTDNCFRLIQMANEYLENNLPAIRIVAHVNAALDGRIASPVQAVFQNMIDNRGKQKCLI